MDEDVGASAVGATTLGEEAAIVTELKQEQESPGKRGISRVLRGLKVGPVGFEPTTKGL